MSFLFILLFYLPEWMLIMSLWLRCGLSYSEMCEKLFVCWVKLCNRRDDHKNEVNDMISGCNKTYQFNLNWNLNCKCESMYGLFLDYRTSITSFHKANGHSLLCLVFWLPRLISLVVKAHTRPRFTGWKSWWSQRSLRILNMNLWNVAVVEDVLYARL